MATFSTIPYSYVPTRPRLKSTAARKPAPEQSGIFDELRCSKIEGFGAGIRALFPAAPAPPAAPATPATKTNLILKKRVVEVIEDIFALFICAMGCAFRNVIVTPAANVAWRGIPVKYFVCENDRALKPEVQRGLIQGVEDLGVEVDVTSYNCGHSPFLSHPQTVVNWIEGVK
ncbi:hypothetical protein B0O99DRAFT_694422 [Bisporella sp. PMI_857]|nr:hypothetical protein B0O99DRAFT_694422 [Bisporella sp. PMI_857]